MRLTTPAALGAAATSAWLAACIVAAPMASAQPAPPAPPAPTPPAPGAPAAGLKTTIEASGTYAVGTDIAPGVYQSAGPVDDGACYWKRSAGDEMVDNRLTKKPAFVQIMPTDTSFTTSDCQAWQLTNAPMPPQPGPGDLLGQLTQAIGSGMFSGGPR
ncbi:hypothetical protein FHR72_000709 [Mycolicibacterium iranicum]|uniref:Lipoprotein n=1 Tax=Mycolicibacterium iranicum TaxID=912594 RepID=A0A839Q7Q5_MYCIR|nr:hypothetical protein [Mycolicibacterium iranicum]MBB2989252.1 hypothetical protein [Mycolicibacterium iranicum]